MLKTILNYVSEVRQRRADKKKTGRSVSLNVRKLLKEAEKERERLWKHPPPCGSVIRYTQKYGYEERHGEFLFSAADVERELKNALRENPHLVNTDEGALLNWVQRRDDSVTEPTDVPLIWDRFKYVANDLVRAGKADIFCMECESAIGADQITTNDDSGKPSWNFDRVICPQGHKLLVVETVHLMTG